MLEDNGATLSSKGSHWDKYIVYNEYMSPQLTNNFMYISNLTLALFEDMGWYVADYNFSMGLQWGKNSGCTFFDQTCSNS